MEAYRRHIVIDNIQKIIYIEVQTALNGNLKGQEYADIKEGRWYKLVPAELRGQFQDCIGNGFLLQPMVNQGAQNEAFYVLQITAIEQKAIIT